MPSPRLRKWRPKSLPAPRREPVYVVVDELEANVAGLVVSRWPSVDERGRLRFDLDADVRLAVDATQLHKLLRKRIAPAGAESPERLRERPLLIGDVFAARLRRRPTADVETPDDPAKWLAQPIVDVSADARDAAKAQYYAAVGGVVDAGEVDAILEEFYEGADPPRRPRRRRRRPEQA